MILLNEEIRNSLQPISLELQARADRKEITIGVFKVKKHESLYANQKINEAKLKILTPHQYMPHISVWLFKIRM